MKLSEAQTIAEKYKSWLMPYCERIEIAGSIRRERPEVKDIEIVCIPRLKDMYAFSTIVNQWKKIKGEATGRYTQRRLPEGINLDLFMANENNWGLIFAIRTGSADFSHKVLAVGWVKAGYKSKNGILYNVKTKALQEIHEEEELFELIGVPYIEPKFREVWLVWGET